MLLLLKMENMVPRGRRWGADAGQAMEGWKAKNPTRITWWGFSY